LTIIKGCLHRLNQVPAIKNLGIFLTGLIAAIIAVYLLGPSAVEIEGITVRAGLAPASTGVTEIRLPPFGVITAQTHQGPLKIYLTVEQIDGESLKAKISDPPDSQELMRKMQQSINEYVYRFATRQLIIAFIAALLTILVIWRCRFISALLQALIVLAVLTVPAIYAVNTYDPQAFKEPEYEGVIGMAPSVIEFASSSLNDLELVKQNTNLIVANLKRLFTNADSLLVMAAPEEQKKAVKVLLVGDLHSNPVGIEFIKSTAQNFRVDFIINTGDLTDLGTATEAESINALETINKPQLFVAGNHDSPEIIKTVSGFDQFRVMNGEMITISGLKVMGFPDPLSGITEVKYNNNEESQLIMAKEAARIKGEIEKLGRPDILVVHNTKLGQELISSADLTVAGHDHRLSVKQQGSALFINPGTAGAAGIRGLYSEEGGYSAVVAYLVPGSGVLAMDFIEYNPASNQFSLHRKMIQASETEETSLP